MIARLAINNQLSYERINYKSLRAFSHFPNNNILDFLTTHFNQNIFASEINPFDAK